MGQIATSAECWDGLAPAWERWAGHLADGLAPVREWLVRELAPWPSDTILELSAGAGDTGFAAAERLGPDGRLISSDASPAMVAVARRRGIARALHDVEWCVLDAQALDLADDAVDGVVCQNGFMLMDDPAAALAETRRVLRPGGRLAFSVWAAPYKQVWGEAPRAVLVEQGHLDPNVQEFSDATSMADPERTRDLLLGAGFTSVHSAEIPMAFSFAGIAEFERWSLEISGIAGTLRALEPSALVQWRTRLAEVVAPYTTPDGRLTLPGVALVTAAA